MLGKLKLISCASLIGLSAYSIGYAQTNTSSAVVDHSNWVQIPGELIRPDCVHEIPNGARVETRNGEITGDVTLNGTLIAHYSACANEGLRTRHGGLNAGLNAGLTPSLGQTPGPTGNGWVEASQWYDSGQNVDLIYGLWNVPSNPKQNGGLIYLFNGIEPTTQSYILQPVLQYGSGYAGGGNYWTIASWLVGGSYVFHSPLVAVSPGNSLFGYTEVTGTSGSTLDWRVQATDENTGNYSWITATSNGLTWSWAYAAVLEAYNITSCAQFPSNLQDTFSDNQVYQGTTTYTLTKPGWYGAFYGYSGGPSCNFGVNISGTPSTLKF